LIEPFKKVLNRGRGARRNNSDPGDFRWLLRLGGQGKRKEHSAERKDKQFLTHKVCPVCKIQN
jgi:hypothetical protein